MRGLSGVTPVLTTIMLVAVAVILVIFLYPWLTSLSSRLEVEWARASITYASTLPMFIRILPPPATGNEGNAIAIIHNAGIHVLPSTTIYIIPPQAPPASPPAVYKLSTNGKVASWKNGSDLAPGETLIVYFPYDTNYFGYRILVTSPNLVVPLSAGVGT